jgi:hypothetical protein
MKRFGVSARHGADELIPVSQIFDHSKRVRSLEIAATAIDVTA